MTQVSGYVATGGTSPLVVPPAIQQQAAPVHLAETSEMLALRQKRVMTIMAMILLPIVMAIVGEELFNAGEVFSVLFLLIPLGITWAVYHYKTQLRRLQEQQLQKHFGMQQPFYQQPQPQPVSMPQPLFQGQPLHSQLPSPTNPLGAANPVLSSVIEDETQKLPINKQ